VQVTNLLQWFVIQIKNELLALEVLIEDLPALDCGDWLQQEE